MRDEDKEAVRRFAAWKHRRREPGSGNADSAAPQDVYADLMRNAFAPALREAGLRGSNGRFELPSEVYWAQLEPYLGKRPRPSTHYGTWADQVRIGSLTSGGEDKWWRLVRGAEVDPVRDDALADLLTYGVPWLRAHATL